ncbi:MAG: hypothetical protein KKA64_00525 [Nanoarchaeota archaeon]|nr:hypothetical protein [Nanoarchaeota archaeon]
MQNKFLKEVVASIAGKPAEEIVELLDKNKNVNEFIIAKKLNLTVNQTRNILYKLSDHGVVSSIRKKDKRKGWYTYFWKIEILKSLEFLKKMLEKSIEQLTSQIKSRETKLFYVCERCNIEFNEENALAHNFTCDECGDIFVLKNNSKVLKDFGKSFSKMKAELEMVNSEIAIERGIIDKKRVKVEKRELVKKAVERAAKKKERLKEIGKNKVKNNKDKKIKKVIKKIIKREIKRGVIGSIKKGFKNIKPHKR